VSAPVPIPTALRALARTPLAARWPHLARLVRGLSDVDPEIRALAASGLAGAAGTGAFAALVAALDDPEPSVRSAAVAALRRSCAADPGRWIHAAFHPRPDVRRMAAAGAAVPGTEEYGLYLMADPEVASLCAISVDAGSVTPLLARVSDGTLCRAVARAYLSDVEWTAVGSLCLEDWAAVLDLFWDPEASEAERGLLLGALALRGEPRWLEAAHVVASRRGGWLPVAVQAAVMRWPTRLADPALPLQLRREAARSLLSLSPAPLPHPDVVALVEAVWAEGHDPERLIGALTLARRPGWVLRSVVSASELREGFASDPEGFAPLLALGRTLSVSLRGRLGPALPRLLAGLLERLSPRWCGVFWRLGELALPVYDEMLARRAPVSPTVAEAARHLVRSQPVAELVTRWLRAPRPEQIGIGVEVFHHARTDRPEALLQALGWLSPRELRRLDVVLAWHPRDGAGGMAEIRALLPAGRPPCARSLPAFEIRALSALEMVQLSTSGAPPAAPSRGLAAALARRAQLDLPDALALLGCHDPAPIVHRELDRALGSDPLAVPRLDVLARAYWRRGNLPPIGHAWLSEDPFHAEALCESLLRDPRGPVQALGGMLSLPRVAGRAKDAVIRVLARWEEEDPERFAAAMQPGALELLRADPVRAESVAPQQAARTLSEEELVESALLAGPAAVSEADLLPLLSTREARERLLQEGRDEEVARELVRALTSRAARGELADRLAKVFAWGVRMGEALRGQRFTFHLLGDSALGYTRLGGTDIHVSPMPLLRGHRGGRDLLEGLILHEIGHHVYHTGQANLAVWAQADAERLGPLLNLVADEHLERRLRSRDRRMGDRFKRLAAHAFQHGARDLDSRWLLRALGGSAASALAHVQLEVSRKPGHVRVRSGSLLGALGRGGEPFGLFVRALRTGRGQRDGHPLVNEALGLFGPGFKDLDMAGLLEVARELARRFGRCAALAECVGGHEHDSVSARDLLAVGRGVTDEQVQRGVHRILQIPPPSQPRGPGAGANTLNVGALAPPGKLAVERVVADSARHAALARQVGPATGALRARLELLGVSRAPVRGRASGRRLDRSRLLALATRGEPRVMVGSEVVLDDDVFVGVIIDCSGSMAGDRIVRAVAFGVLVAEAARGLPSIEVRLFGFDDRRLFDAGDASRCAVASLRADGGNDDAAALAHVAEVARRSGRQTRILVMVSDGSPSHCSVATLSEAVRALVREGMVCVQVGVAPLPSLCFPEYVLIDKGTLPHAAARFGALIGRLVART
jgi:hypothetical protein